MKKIYVLLCLGAFLVTAGASARLYAYPQMAVVPDDLDTTVVAANAADAPATYFAIGELSEKTAALKSTTVARIDQEASTAATEEVGRDVQVLEIYACTDLATVVCSETRYPISASIRRFAIDKATGEAVEWSGSSLETGGTVERDVATEGYTVKLPFNVEKRTYPMWNADLGRTIDATYEGEDELQGLRVFRFKTEVPPTVTKELELPGSLVGSEEPTVIAEQVISNQNTLFVEPETGVILSAISSQDSYAQVDGERVFTTVNGTFVGDEATVTEAVEEYQSLSRSLYVLRFVFPVGAITLGALLLLLGVALMRRRRHAEAPAQPNRQVREVAHA